MTKELTSWLCPSCTTEKHKQYFHMEPWGGGQIRISCQSCGLAWTEELDSKSQNRFLGQGLP